MIGGGDRIVEPLRTRSLLVFITVALVIALPAIVAVWHLGHLPMHLAMNRYHSPGLDFAFTYITELANGWVPVVFALVLLRKSWRAFLMMGLATAISGMLAQMLKQLAFPTVVRPSMLFQSMPGLPIVPGLELHHYMSFPSGHATAAFAMCMALAIVFARPWVAALLAVVASILAYSRVYLSQHFTEDILAGAMVGSLVGIGVYLLLYRGKWARRNGLDRSPFVRQNQ